MENKEDKSRKTMSNEIPHHFGCTPHPDRLTNFDYEEIEIQQRH